MKKLQFKEKQKIVRRINTILDNKWNCMNGKPGAITTDQLEREAREIVWIKADLISQGYHNSAQQLNVYINYIELWFYEFTINNFLEIMSNDIIEMMPNKK